jgi:hypothetical protein
VTYRWYLDDIENVAHNDQNIIEITENGVPLPDSQYMPYLAWDVVYYIPYKGLMNTDYSSIDRYSAAALNLIAGHRATKGNSNAPGNMGVYLSRDLPEQNQPTLKEINGLRYYTDRTYTITGGVPSWMVGRMLIQTPNDQKKNSSGSGYIRFENPVNWWVYVLFDRRSTNVPNWLNGWQRYTNYPDIETSLATQPGLKMYRKMFDAGQCVDLGGNYGPGSSDEYRSNYTVVYGK